MGIKVKKIKEMVCRCNNATFKRLYKLGIATMADIGDRKTVPLEELDTLPERIEFIDIKIYACIKCGEIFDSKNALEEFKKE